MVIRNRVFVCFLIWWIVISVLNAVTIEENGQRPDDVTRINDNSVYTCSTFLAERHQYTQIFEQAVCASEEMSVTLVGREMKCLESIHLVGLTGSDVGKSLNVWKKCQRRWYTTTDSGVEWCSYDCRCSGTCEQVMVLRWPRTPTDNSWTLCDISQHCNGTCPEAPCHNGGTCINGSCLCPAYCHGKYCENCDKDPYPPPVKLTIGTTTLNVIYDKGWLVVLRRRDEVANFYGGCCWVSYEEGFGSLSGQFWLGNKHLHLITNNGSTYRCRVEILTKDNIWLWAEYGTFYVGPASDNYRLHVDGYNVNSTAGDAWTNDAHWPDKVITNRQFSTIERDHDGCSDNCAQVYRAGWWYSACSDGCLASKDGPQWLDIQNILFADLMLKAN